MHIVIFFIIISVLVIVHEWGHFLMARIVGVKILTFALGFPPTLLKKKIGETEYKLNLLLFGGYVSLYGEAHDSYTDETLDTSRSLVHKHPLKQIVVFIGGVLFNFLFAWILITASLWIGAPTVATPDNQYDLVNPALTITMVAPGSPAEEVGLTAGMIIDHIVVDGTDIVEPSDTDTVIRLVREHDVLTFYTASSRKESADLQSFEVYPREGIIPGVKGIGIGMDIIGTQHASFLEGIGQGLVRTVTMTGQITHELGKLITGKGSFKSLTGPVGLVGVVGDAQASGLTSLLMLSAAISLNLLIINLVPLPALDGGRILIVIIEWIRRKRLPSRVIGWLSAGSFGLLILLMLVITAKDIFKF